MYLKKGDFPAALNSYKNADSIAIVIPAYKELDSAYMGLAATYGQMGDYNNAYR
jgi:hypothetical protein